GQRLMRPFQGRASEGWGCSPSRRRGVALGYLRPPLRGSGPPRGSGASLLPRGRGIMSWPLSQDYNEAIQDPQNSFRDPELRAGEAAVNALGLPMPRSGNFADVYEFRCPQTGNSWALKCFTRHVPG